MTHSTIDTYLTRKCSRTDLPIDRRWNEPKVRSVSCGCYRGLRRKRRAFVMTDTELKLIAALAIMGLSNQCHNG